MKFRGGGYAGEARIKVGRQCKPPRGVIMHWALSDFRGRSSASCPPPCPTLPYPNLPYTHARRSWDVSRLHHATCQPPMMWVTSSRSRFERGETDRKGPRGCGLLENVSGQKSVLGLKLQGGAMGMYSWEKGGNESL